MPCASLKNSPTVIPILGMALFLLFAGSSCQKLQVEEKFQLTTDHIEYVSEGSYRITGTLVSLEDHAITRQGVCWSESSEPDLECSLEELDPPFSSGEFNLLVSGLSASTSYYFRVFASTNTSIFYSEVKEYTTRLAAEDMVMDVCGNIYQVIKIGEQTWMADNLKATMYADRTPIPYVEDSMEWFDFTRESLGYCWYGNIVSNGYTMGGLYTWAAATAAHDGISLIEEGVQGVCPDGWHLPSDAEWKQLERHLGMSPEEAEASKWRGTDQGGKLKQEGIGYWKNPNDGGTDEIGFTALPGGYRHGSGEFKDISETARFWTSSSNGYGYAWFRELDYDTAAIFRDFSGVYRGHSVRCVKDP